MKGFCYLWITNKHKMKKLGKELNKTCYSLAPQHSVFVASFLSILFDKLFRYNIRSRLFPLLRLLFSKIYTFNCNLFPIAIFFTTLSLKATEVTIIFICVLKIHPFFFFYLFIHLSKSNHFSFLIDNIPLSIPTLE